jgi:hypothetical protein
MKRSAFLLILAGLLCGCQSMYYGAMEKVGVHKRDIMVERVKAARDTQDATKQQFVSAMEAFKSVVNFKGGDLEKEYDRLNGVLQKSEAGASAVRSRIGSVEDVSDALFSEWRKEIKQYSSDSLRKASQQKYDLTKKKYGDLIAAMKKAESKLEPALAPLRDQVLFLKHNLNAKAIAGLSEELATVQVNVDKLVRDMETSIAEADKFIASLQE